MDIHYNAFISYRHHPQDIKVAEEVQRRLEHFHVPGALKKQGKKIDRLFRDKDELPITSSLTDTITMALQNSDYLIVICSTHLKGSYWVQREIETFLKTHTKDQILTVLVDGENPYDVIPEILTYNEVVDPVTGQTLREPIEPLSCDWRLPRKRAVKEELPRLAAALLDCTYDELRQRQRQYKMRRMIAGFSIGICVSLALAGYFLYSSIQIQKNLNESLRNQSQYLASASQESFANGDRLTAIALALEALPDEQDDRPYVAYAQLALTDALSLYDATEQVISVAAFDADATISDFIVTDDAHTLYILDNRGTITSWDTYTFEKLSSIHISGTDYALMTDNESNLLVLCDDENQTLQCYSREGALLWQLKNCEDAAFCVGKETLFVLRSEDVPDSESWGMQRHYLLRVNPEDGQLLEDPIYMFDSNTGDFPALESDTYYDNQPLCVSASLNADVSRFLFDPQTGKVSQLLSDDERVYCASMTENGRVFLLVSDGTGSMNGRWQNINVYSPAGAALYCFDADSAEVLWTTQLHTYLFSSQDTIAEIPGTGNIVCQYGNAFFQLDGATGEIIAQCHAASYPLATKAEDTYLWAVYGDGSAGNYYYDDNEIYTIEYVDKTLLQSSMNHGLYTLAQLDTRVVLYRSTTDESHEVFTGTYGSYISDIDFHGDYMVTESADSIYLFNLATREMLWSRELGDLGSLVGFLPDGSKIIYYDNHNRITELSVLTGEAEQWMLPFSDSLDYGIKYDTVWITESGYVFLVSEYAEEQEYIVFYDSETGNYEMFNFLTEEESALGLSYAEFNVEYVSDRYVLVFTPGNNLYQFDRSTCQSRLIFGELEDRPNFLLDEEQDMLTIALGQEILVLDSGREVIRSILLPNVAAVSFCYHGGELLALCDDGQLYRFDDAGQHLSTTNLSLYDSFFSSTKYLYMQEIGITWDFTPDGELILNALEMGNIIHTEQWMRTCDVPDLIAYHPGTDSFICAGSNQIYAYKRCSLAEMTRQAEQLLNGFELSDDQKAYYGLD